AFREVCNKENAMPIRAFLAAVLGLSFLAPAAPVTAQSARSLPPLQLAQADKKGEDEAGQKAGPRGSGRDDATRSRDQDRSRESGKDAENARREAAEKAKAAREAEAKAKAERDTKARAEAEAKAKAAREADTKA